MPVDWAAVSEAIRLGTIGRASEGLRLLIAQEASCQSDRDRSAICNGKAMCYAHLANFAEALAQITAAKQLAGTEQDLMLQIGLAEAATHILTAEYQTACDLYQHIAETYSDLLAEDHESAQEFRERFGYALVLVKKYDEAIHIFQQLLTLGPVPDEQRVRLFLGAALAAKGRSQRARIELDLAAKGPDPELSKDALDRIESLISVQ